MMIPHAIPTHHALSEDVPEANTDRMRAIQRPRSIRPLLPIELEKTQLTPTIGMPALPKSVQTTPPAMTPPPLMTTARVVTTIYAHTPACEAPVYSSDDPCGRHKGLGGRLTPDKPFEKASFGSGEHIYPSWSVADVAECAQIIGPAGVNAVFRALPFASAPKILNQMERRERIVFLLLDGRRTLRDVARLVHRSELDVARILVHLSKQHYIENQRA